METTSEVNGLKNSAAKNINNVGDSLRQVGEGVAKSAEAIYSEVKSTSKDALEASKDALNSCVDTGAKQVDHISSYIQENPIKSVLAAVGVGILVSRFSRQ